MIGNQIIVVLPRYEGGWEEQTGDGLEDFGQWMIEEYSDEMMSSW